MVPTYKQYELLFLYVFFFWASISIVYISENSKGYKCTSSILWAPQDLELKQRMLIHVHRRLWLQQKQSWWSKGRWWLEFQQKSWKHSKAAVALPTDFWISKGPKMLCIKWPSTPESAFYLLERVDFRPRHRWSPRTLPCLCCTMWIPPIALLPLGSTPRCDRRSLCVCLICLLIALRMSLIHLLRVPNWYFAIII